MAASASAAAAPPPEPSVPKGPKAAKVYQKIVVVPPTVVRMPAVSRYAAEEGEEDGIMIAIDIEATGERIVRAADPGETKMNKNARKKLQRRKLSSGVEIDVEPKDRIFAYGISASRFNPTTGKVREIERRCRVLKLNKPDGMEWADFWIQEGFELRCWEEFWKKEVPMLERLQATATVSSYAALAALAVQDLKDIEDEVRNCNGGKLGNTHFGWGTMEFDTVAITALLLDGGASTMGRSRDGSWCGGGHYLWSYVAGLKGLTLTEANWENTKAQMRELTVAAMAMVKADHDPANDALFLATKFWLASRIVVKSVAEQMAEDRAEEAEAELMEARKIIERLREHMRALGIAEPAAPSSE